MIFLPYSLQEIHSLAMPQETRVHSQAVTPSEWTVGDWSIVGGAVGAAAMWLWRHTLKAWFKFLVDALKGPGRIGDLTVMVNKLVGEIAYAQAIGHAMPDLIDRPIWFSDAAGRCLGCNDFFVRMLVRQKSEILGDAWRTIIHADDRDMVTRQWDAAVQDRRDFALSYRIVASNGTEIPIFSLASCLRAPDGSVIGWIGKITLTEP